MTDNRLRVGIVGLEPGRSWGAQAHVPALQALSDTFEIAGIANTSAESGARAAAALGLAKAYPDVAALVRAPDVDIVAVTVKVPHHREVVAAAIEAGKHVLCEWPLGNGLTEAQDLAALARTRGVRGFVGTQGCVAPEVQHLRQLIEDGFIGEILSTTLVGRSHGWGGIIPFSKGLAYLFDKSMGATMLTVPVGHALAAVRSALGDLVELSSVLSTRRSHVTVADTGERLPVDTPDQVLVSGLLASGAPLSVHYRGGTRLQSEGLLWEVNGSHGDLRIVGPIGHMQNMPLVLEGAQGDAKAFTRLAIPERYVAGFPDNVVPGNVARLYARIAQDLNTGTQSAPTFDDAVVLHRQIDAIEQAAVQGRRVRLDAT